MTHRRLIALLAFLLLLVSDTGWAACCCHAAGMAPAPVAAEAGCAGMHGSQASARTPCPHLSAGCTSCATTAILSAQTQLQSGIRLDLEPFFARTPLIPRVAALAAAPALPAPASDPPIPRQTPISLRTRLLV